MRGRGEGSIRQRERKDGSVYWEARVSIDGRQYSFYDDTKSGAQALARAARADADRGVVRPRESLTVEEYLTDWLEHTVKVSVRARTYKGYREHCVDYIIPALGHLRVTDVTPGHVQRMLAEMLRRGLSETTVRHARATLSGALKAAQQDYGLQRNAASLAKVPKSDRPAFQREVITPADARRLLDAFRGSRLEPAVMFAAATGLRQGELLALRWQDIDVERRTLTVQHAVDIQDGQRVLARPKTKKAQRTLALPDMALRALELRRLQMEEDRILAGDAWEGGELVFANPQGGMRSGTTLTHNFREHLKRRGLKPVRWHALRRVFAAILQDQGVPLVQIRDLMGHSQLSVTESYAYTMPDSLLDAMNAVDQALGPGAVPTEGVRRQSQLGYD